MKNWRIIYESYRDKATYYNIFKEKIKTVSIIEGIVLSFCCVLALLSIFFIIFDPNCNWKLNIICDRYIYFAIVIICEFIVLLILNHAGNRLPIYTYKDKKEDKKRKIVSSPPDVSSYRYLLFKNNLENNKITKKLVKIYLPLADIKISLVSSDKFNARIADIKFLLGFGLGILGTLWKQLQPQELLIVFLLFSLGLMFLAIFMFVIPSKIEKAKELKYFMMLYLAEKDIPEHL